ncbi:hypothetical protein EWM64_g7637 [Hericium alpestre]|uniref:Nucleoporin NUP188 n=1 Tax=Hericium alpestre TaxID=135208 RepID=A0A4Y9ZND3_9AGAM|nr:hypothetical protein EWM64_g7637 [Hericium alpestre]
MSVDETLQKRPLIDVTYQSLYLLLSGYESPSSPEQAEGLLQARLPVFKDIRHPFGKPNPESKKKLDANKVTLRDGSVVDVEPGDREYILAICETFQIDEIEALTLFRSFIYNEGLPKEDKEIPIAAFRDKVIEAFMPFYDAERRCVARVLAPLFRANDEVDSPFYESATKLLPKVVPDGEAFVKDVVSAYLDKTRTPIPDSMSRDPKLSARWAKENLKDQLAFLELLFWAIWSYVPRSGPAVVQIYEAAYQTNLGSNQQNGILILDEESARLQQDCAAVWILIMIEVLELERLSEGGRIEISADPSDKSIYTAYPNSLRRIHELVVSHGDGHFACIFLAWTLVLSKLEAAAAEIPECPPSYQAFFKSLDTEASQPYTKDRNHANEIMLQHVLDPATGLFNLLVTLLTTTPLFVTSIAWRTDSSISEPNAVAYRSVMKGLLIALSERVQVEHIPDYDGLIEVWVSLFGRSESNVVLGLCLQFWQYDFERSPARRAILDVARARFPVQFRPLLRLLRAFTGAGFMNTDSLDNVDHRRHVEGALTEGHAFCAQKVADFFDSLPTFTQIIPISACSGAHALYEKVPERYRGASSSVGLTYLNLRPIRLPGGSILPPKSAGRLLSQEGEDSIIVAWEHVHSGWKLLRDVLLHYARSKRLIPTSYAPSAYTPAGIRRASPQQPVTLRLEDIGIDLDADGDAAAVVDALDLLRSVVDAKQDMANEVLKSLEDGDHAQNPSPSEGSFDVVQLTMLILEDALSSSAKNRKSPQTQLITSALSLLSSLLSIPEQALRVWLFLRSSSSLFNTNRSSASASAALSIERNTGSYFVTWSLLDLVQNLFTEASSTVLVTLRDRPRLQDVKEEVLLRALRFVHAEVWMEHVGWKYAQLSHRFEIGRIISSLYGNILQDAPPTNPEGALSAVSRAVFEALVTKATTSSIGPLVSAITTSGALFRRIHASRQLNNLKGLYFLLRSHMRVIRLCLTYKQKLYATDGQCLLEQALCTRDGGFGSSISAARAKNDPLDVLVGFVDNPHRGSQIALEAARVLYALCASLSSSQPSAPTIVGHLSNPEAMVASFVRVAHHPYQELEVRLAVWRFMSLAVEKEPALGDLFVIGHFRISHVGKMIADGEEKEKGRDTQTSALQAARDMLKGWEEYWHSNPTLLSAFLGFLVSAWQRGLEHKEQISAVREDTDFWSNLVGIIQQDLPPPPDYRSTSFVEQENGLRSSFHESVSMHAYHTLAKAQAVRLIALDIEMHPSIANGTQGKSKPQSYVSIERIIHSKDQLADHIGDATSNIYDPTLYDEFAERIQSSFPALTLQQLECTTLFAERELGDAFAFDPALLRLRTEPSITEQDVAAEALNNLFSINMNLSLAHAQTELGQSWQFLLSKVFPFLSGPSFRPAGLSLAAAIAGNIAAEQRSGDLMATIHATRLSVLLALLELAWFSTSDSEEEVKSFISLVESVHNITVNESQSPLRSIRNSTTAPFHQTLLQIIYFCARQCRHLAIHPKMLTAERRLTIAAMLDATLAFVIDALRYVFEAARSRLDVDLDLDMKLLVAVFEQSTRTSINPSTTLWLTRCQESDVLRCSLELFSQTDLTGLSNLALVRARKQPLYAPHILTFHIAFASITVPAERLASEGILIAYSNNSISSAISSGSVEVSLPELPGERNPAHRAYCDMLSVVAGVLTALGMQKHFFDAEASGFVQLYGNQIQRALSWTVGDPLSLPLVEEMERVVALFHSIALNTPSGAKRNGATDTILSAFSKNALLLLQQLNYALTHPNHLASLIEPVTADERAQLEKDSKESNDRALVDIVDPVKKPFLAGLIHRLFALCGNIICTLIATSASEMVLKGETEDLPSGIALVVPVRTHNPPSRAYSP